MPSLALKTTKLTLDLVTKFIKADVRTHNLAAIQPGMAIIFVVNHFTRIETLLLPYELYKGTGLEAWSLASGDLFADRWGSMILRKLGTLSTKDPDRDRVILSSLLAGEHPWIIFPEGAMIKDKKLVNRLGAFSVFHYRGGRRAPHTGAAALALRAEYYRQKLQCIHDNPKLAGMDEVLAKFGLASFEQASNQRTVIIPINITYYPIRAHQNLLLKLVGGIAKNLSQRAIEELSVEGSILAKDSDVDINIGQPIEIRSYLERPEFAELMACSDDDIRKLEEDPRSIFSETAREIMHRYMQDIYGLTTVNFDHIFGTLMRAQKPGFFTERSFRNRVFLASHGIVSLQDQPLHTLLRDRYREILYEEPNPKLNDFIELCISEKMLEKADGGYKKNAARNGKPTEFHLIRSTELTQVIVNEIEPLTRVTAVLQRAAKMSRPELSQTIREMILKEDAEIFEKDYAEFGGAKDQSPETGRPFLIVPKKFHAGIVLSHGYLSAPLEVRAMAEFFAGRGYAVYGVRLKGHGTSPEDLSQTKWEDWYESYNRGYTIIKSLTDNIILGGFSFGSGLALMAAGRKREKIRAVFAINAPLELRHYAAPMVPSIAGLNSMLRRIRHPKKSWEYMQHDPENSHINYHSNPVSALKQLGDAMREMEVVLKDITAPTLIIQGSRDPTVDQTSGRLIFSQVGTLDKELTVYERDRHGIINGKDAIDVYNRVSQFLDWAEGRRQEPALQAVASAGK